MPQMTIKGIHDELAQMAWELMSLTPVQDDDEIIPIRDFLGWHILQMADIVCEPRLYEMFQKRLEIRKRRVS